MKKFLSFLLSLVIVSGLFTSMPHTGFFPGVVANAAQTGTCGQNITWTLDDNGVLTVSGSGQMTDYDFKSVPWYEYYENIESVVIENGVTSIGKNAFYGLTSLKSVTIADSVTSIGIQAFGVCPYITSVNIPTSVISIADYAFYGCARLVSIKIPDSVIDMGEYTFSNCTNLESAEIGNSLTDLGTGIFQECKKLESVTLGNKVTNIGDIAFYNCAGLKNIKNLDGVITIGQYAFLNCVGLTAIDIPDTVTSVGTGAFEGCINVDTLTFGSGISIISEYAFRNCSALTSVVVADNITTIGSGAFEDCSGLESVIISGGVSEIGEYAFAGCEKLATITISDNVTRIGANAFNKTSYYKNTDNWENGVLYINNHLIKVNDTTSESLFIKEGTKCIADSAFSFSNNLTSVNIPDSMTSMGAQAIAYCSNLKSINIPSGVTYIGYNAIGYSSGAKIAGFVIYGAADSAAEAYANENGFEFVEEHTHTQAEWITVTEPTCDSVGEKYTICSTCGEKVTEEIPALGHKYSDEWTVDEEPTYAKEGSKSRHCLQCSGKTDITAIPVKDFNEVVYAVADGGVYNGEITYVFYLKAKVAVKGVVLNLVFDSDVLEPVDSKSGAYLVSDSEGNLNQNLSGMYVSGMKTNTEDTYIIGYANSSGVKKSVDKAFMKVTFKVKDLLKAQTELNFYCVEFNSPDSTYNVPKNEKNPAIIGSRIVDISGGQYDLTATENTTIDYENHLIFTTVYECENPEDMFGLGEDITILTTANHIVGGLKLYGTGATVSVYYQNEYKCDYKIVVIGDLNGDSVCDVLDATLAERISTDKTSATTEQIYAANGCFSDTLDASSYQNVVNTALSI